MQAYRQEDDAKQFCGMVDSLAFLAENEVVDGMEFMRQSVPSGQHEHQLQALLTYVDSMYVRVRQWRRTTRSATDGLQLSQTAADSTAPPTAAVSTGHVERARLRPDQQPVRVIESWI